MEHVICKHIRNHLDTYNVLSPLQHGFRYQHSCESQLLLTTHDLIRTRDKNIQLDIAILDFSKAFDTVPHRKLLHKLSNYGIKGHLHRWIQNFLMTREQRVVVDGVASEPACVDSGVPQGTVLGPLLFLLHINDLPRVVNSKVRLFADDCLLYREIRNARDQHQLQDDLDSLQSWGDNWGMRFNPQKCNIMRISRKKKPFSCFYTLSGQVLQETTNAKYLGLTISNDLTWSTHMAETIKKGNSTLGFIRRNLKGSPASAKELAYQAMVRSAMEYGAAIWDPHTKEATDRVEMVQRRAARFVTNRYHRTQSVTALLEDLGWDTLQQRREDMRLAIIFKINTGVVAVPAEAVNLERTSTRIRRANPYNFKQIRATTTEYQQACIPRTIPIWNKLPQHTVEADSTQAFKQYLRDSRRGIKKNQ